jgi:tetratricopeptide (TPR) repeat protein
LLELVGWCQYRLGHLETACQAFEQALAVNADWLSVRFDLGLVQLVLGRGAEADAHYSHGLALLAAPGGAARRGAAMVALDDLDDAVRRWPAMLAPQAASQRSHLQRAISQFSGAEDVHVDG